MEVPEAGIAVTFPADWEVRRLTDRSSAPSDLAGPDVEVWDVVGGVAPDFEAGRCVVQQIRASALTTAAVAEWFQRRGPGSPDREMSVMTVRLPAGDAILIETILLDVEESPSPGPGVALEDAVESSFEPDASRLVRQYQPTYVLDTGDAISMLVCFGEVPPADHWLSIAETIDFLPAEE